MHQTSALQGPRHRTAFATGPVRSNRHLILHQIPALWSRALSRASSLARPKHRAIALLGQGCNLRSGCVVRGCFGGRAALNPIQSPATVGTLLCEPPHLPFTHALEACLTPDASVELTCVSLFRRPPLPWWASRLCLPSKHCGACSGGICPRVGGPPHVQRRVAINAKRNGTRASGYTVVLIDYIVRHVLRLVYLSYQSHLQPVTSSDTAWCTHLLSLLPC